MRLLLSIALTLVCMMLRASPAAGTAPVAADSMEERVRPCVACHRPEGLAGRDAYYPRIAGKPAGYLFNQLLNFREGRRHYRPMSVLIEHLSDEYLREMSAHFASLSPPYPPPQPTGLSAADAGRARMLVNTGDRQRNIPACAACHGEALMGVAPAIPGLLGLPRDYINAQFGAWRNKTRRARPPDCMADIASRLMPAEASTLATWLAAQPVLANAKPAAATKSALPLDCGGLDNKVRNETGPGGRSR